MPKFNVASYLKDTHGIDFKGVGENGQPEYWSPNGDVIQLDVPGLLKEDGVPVDKLQLEYNSPETSQDAPVNIDITDRKNMALGDTRGSIKYLKQKFEDVSFIPERGLSVLDKDGLWKNVDKSSYDPYELTADIVEGAVSLAPAAVGSIIGGAAGALSANPIGVIAGAGAGGAAAAGLVRGTLGRLAGTYDATADEELSNAGIEFLANAAGAAIPLGAKPTKEWFMKAVSKFTPTGEGSKEIMAKVLSTTTRKSPEVMKTLIDDSAMVNGYMDKALSKVGSVQAPTELKYAAVQELKKAAEMAPKALSAEYGRLTEAVAKQTPKSLSINFTSMVDDVEKELIESGWAFRANDKGPLIAMTAERAAKARSQGMVAESFSDQTTGKVNQLLRELNSQKHLGQQSGYNATKNAFKIKTQLNNLQGDLNIETLKSSPNLVRLATQVDESLSSKIADKYDKAGLLKMFQEPSNLYKRYKSAVDSMSNTLNTQNGPEVLLNNLMAAGNKNASKKTETDLVFDLLGLHGQKLMRIAKAKYSASELLPVLPAGQGSFGGIANMLQKSVGLPVSSPRMVAREVRAGAEYLKRVNNWMTTRSPQELKELRSNPKLLEKTLSSVFEAMAQEKNAEQQLNQQIDQHGQQ